MRRRPDLLLLLAILALVAFGVLLLASASSVLGIDLTGDPYTFAKHQIFYGVIPGLVALFVMMNIPYRILRKIVIPFLLLVIALLILVFIPPFQTSASGAARWVTLGPISIQPSELAKLALVLYLAALLSGRDIRGGHVRETLLPFVTVVGMIAFLLIAQPNLGTLVLIIATTMFMYAAAGAPLTQLAGMVTVASVLLLVLIRTAPYRLARLITFLRPETDPKGIGYQAQQALIAIGSGGMWGFGIGRSRQKFRYLPEPAGDAIFAIAAEELGFIRIVLFLLLYLFIILRGYRIAQTCPDPFGRLVAVGITSWFLIQAFVHIGANAGIVPLTGIPLPFVSYGGSALVMSLAGAGILLNISKYAQES